MEFGWILSRDPDFRNTEEFQQVFTAAVNNFGFKYSGVILAEQAGCKDVKYRDAKYYPIDGPRGPSN